LQSLLFLLPPAPWARPEYSWTWSSRPPITIIPKKSGQPSTNRNDGQEKGETTNEISERAQNDFGVRVCERIVRHLSEVGSFDGRYDERALDGIEEETGHEAISSGRG
jgi:hypothetical protein